MQVARRGSSGYNTNFYIIKKGSKQLLADMKCGTIIETQHEQSLVIQILTVLPTWTLNRDL